MSFGILRRFLNPSASNNKSIWLRRFLNTAASDSIPPISQCRDAVHNGNGGSQFRDAVSVQDEIDKELGRTGILITLAGICVYLADEEFVTKPAAENRRRELLENLPTDDELKLRESKYKYWRECSEKCKIEEEKAAKVQKVLLEELEELMELTIKTDKSGPNI